MIHSFIYVAPAQRRVRHEAREVAAGDVEVEPPPVRVPRLGELYNHIYTCIIAYEIL